MKHKNIKQYEEKNAPMINHDITLEEIEAACRAHQKENDITNITDTCILQITLLFTVHSITKDSLLCHGNLRLRSNILQSREGLPCTSRTALPRV